MRFNKHLELADKHAFLSPSSYHWLNYDEEKLRLRYRSAQAARRGTDLHNLAHEAVRLNVKLARTNKAIAAYVNDAVGYKMQCEVPLYYSEFCFGHADTIGFTRNKLRVHDLKTGLTPAKFKQLIVYAALFCLEYSVDPNDIEIELRIYQGDNIDKYLPMGEEVEAAMRKIVESDRILREYRNSDML